LYIPTKEEFLLGDREARDVIAVRRIYVWITGDITSGSLLSQILYWHGISKKTGKPRLKIKKLGRLWLAKTAEEWFIEVGLSRRQVDTAMSKLVGMELLEKKLFKFNGSPTVHVSLNWTVFLRELGKARIRQENWFEERRKKQEEEEEPDPEIPFSHIRQIQSTYKPNPLHKTANSLTETTAETTAETTFSGSLAAPQKTEDISSRDFGFGEGCRNSLPQNATDCRSEDMGLRETIAEAKASSRKAADEKQRKKAARPATYEKDGVTKMSVLAMWDHWELLRKDAGYDFPDEKTNRALGEMKNFLNSQLVAGRTEVQIKKHFETIVEKWSDIREQNVTNENGYEVHIPYAPTWKFYYLQRRAIHSIITQIQGTPSDAGGLSRAEVARRLKS